jgi:hypothetical protein
MQRSLLIRKMKQTHMWKEEKYDPKDEKITYAER